MILLVIVMELYPYFSFTNTPSVHDISVLLHFRQCLNRRLDNMDEVEREVKAWVEHRNKNAYVVNWQFTTEDARIKLKRLYPTIKDKINLME